MTCTLQFSPTPHPDAPYCLLPTPGFPPLSLVWPAQPPLAPGLVTSAPEQLSAASPNSMPAPSCKLSLCALCHAAHLRVSQVPVFKLPPYHFPGPVTPALGASCCFVLFRFGHDHGTQGHRRTEVRCRVLTPNSKRLLKFRTLGPSLHPPAQDALVVGTQLRHKWKSRLEGRGSPCRVTGQLPSPGAVAGEQICVSRRGGPGSPRAELPGKRRRLSESGAGPAASCFLSWSPGSGFSSQMSGPNLRALARSPASACDAAAPRNVTQRGQPQRPGAGGAAPTGTPPHHGPALGVRLCLYTSYTEMHGFSFVFTAPVTSEQTWWKSS